jgi:effector-binding domain-containing protein
MSTTRHQIEERELPAQLVGGIRTRGRYADCAGVFRQLGRKLGRHIGGKAMMLCYDEEFREDDADFEPCMPLKRAVEVEGVEVRELPAGRCISLVHHGPYETLTRSYSQLLEYAAEKGLQLQVPSREVYLKGPGLIFKGNPKNYLTELQFMIQE